MKENWEKGKGKTGGGETAHIFCAVLESKLKFLALWSNENFVIYFHRPKISSSAYSVSVSSCWSIRIQLWKQISQLLELSRNQGISQEAKALFTFYLGSMRVM